MSVLRNLESKIAGLVEGTFGRVFRSEVRPGRDRAQARARDGRAQDGLGVAHLRPQRVRRLALAARTASGSRASRARSSSELAAYLLEHARRERLALLSRPQIEFRTDERLRLGEFGIQARLVPPETRAASRSRAEADHGHTMVYSTPAARGAARRGARRRGGARRCSWPRASACSCRPGGATIGRSRECDIVLGDSNVSRQHAEIRPRGGGWTITDLGSTNGVRVNGRRIDGPRGCVRPATGSSSAPSTITFELE